MTLIIVFYGLMPYLAFFNKFELFRHIYGRSENPVSCYNISKSSDNNELAGYEKNLKEQTRLEIPGIPNEPVLFYSCECDDSPSVLLFLWKLIQARLEYFPDEPEYSFYP